LRLTKDTSSEHTLKPWRTIRWVITDLAGEFSRAQGTFVDREFLSTFTSHENARLLVSGRQPTQYLEAHTEAFRFVSADRLITAKDHAAIQISVADVDANGVAQNTSTSFAISGQVRAMGESDDSLNRLATKAGRESLRLLVRSFRSSNGCRYFSLDPWWILCGDSSISVLRNVWSYQK
jgi:hypothetical protein